MKRILLITCGIIAIAFFGIVVISLMLEDNTPVMSDQKNTVKFIPVRTGFELGSPIHF